MPIDPIETARLHLRCIAPGDAEALSLLMTPGVSARVGHWCYPFTMEMAHERVATARSSAKAGDALPLAIVERATGEVIGWISLNRNGDDSSCASLGYWLGEAHHGQGYMREAARAVVAAGFGRLGVTVIEATAHHDNAGSIAVLVGCGMKAHGERVIYASARDREELCALFAVER